MIAALAAVVLLLQTPPRFDAVSVKPDRSGAPSSAEWNRPGRVTLTAFNLRQLLTRGLDLASLSDAANLVVGWPSWADSMRFNVEATASGTPDVAAKRAMLLALLRDRFALAVHRETRRRPVYALVLDRAGKLGSALHARAPGTPCPVDVAAEDPLLHFACGETQGGLIHGDHTAIWSGARGETLDAVAADLGGMEAMDRPILDRTGLKGLFDYRIEWRHLDDATTPDAPRADLFAAVRDQLGLKLDPITAPIAIWVIDRVALPTGD